MAMSIPIVVLDPGHGGTQEIGGSSPNNAKGPNGLLEKNLTLDIAQRVAASLAGRAQVILTRTDDSNLSLAARAAVARTNKALLFLSIHLNGWRDANVDGTEVYVARTATDKSRGFAQRVLSRLLAVTKVANRGVKQEDFGVIKSARHAPETGVCLAEIAFLTNQAQARRLESEEYRQALAGALVDAIGQYLPAEHFLHHDAARPDRRVPPPVPFSLGTMPHAFWMGAQSYERAPVAALDSRPRFVLGKKVGEKGDNLGDDVLALKERLIELGFDWLKRDRSMDKDTIKAIRLFQSIIGGDPDKALAGDGLVDVPGNTYRWLQADNAPRWQLMPAGSPAEGFDNIELPNTKDQHDYGTNWIADALRGAGAHYRDNYLKTNPKAALLTINDVSMPHGGDTPDHGGHERGMACDLRLPRKDGTAPAGTDINHPQYDKAAARAMLQALRAQPLHKHIFFNDADLVREGLCHKTSKDDHVHDDHIHFAIKPPTQGAIEMIDASAGVQAPSSAPAKGKAAGSSAQAFDWMGDDEDDPWSRSFEASEQTTCGCAHCADCASPAARMLERDTPPACGCNKDIPAGKIDDEKCPLLLPAPKKTTPSHGTVTPNLYLCWNDIKAGTCLVDVVVHFHGHAIDLKKPAELTAPMRVAFSGLQTLQTLRAGRPTLGIIPLGRFVGGSAYDFPFFTDGNPDGLDLMIKYALTRLAQKHGLGDDTFKPGRLILSAHSGGGAALTQVLALPFNSKDKKDKRRRYDVHEVHLFDALYGGAQSVIDWATAGIKADLADKLTPQQMPTRGHALRVLYLPCSNDNWEFKKKRGRCSNSETETNSRRVELGLASTLGSSFLRDWYRVEQSAVGHMSMPGTYGPQLLTNAGGALKPPPNKPAKKPDCCPAWPNACEIPTTCKGMPEQPAETKEPAGAGR